MSPDDGSPDDMGLLHLRHRHLTLDESTAERLVSGELAPDDAPPAYAPVARLLEDATAPAQAHEMDGEAAAVAMFISERSPAGERLDRGRRRRAVRFSARSAAVAVAGALVLTGGVAAAATGRLPDAVQGAAHDTLRHIGVSIPGTTAQSNHGQDVKTTAHDPTISGDDKGHAVCAEASAGKCAPDQGGQGNPTSTDDTGPAAGNAQGQAHTPTTGPPNGVPGHPHETVPSTTASTDPPVGPPSTTHPGRSGAGTANSSNQAH
jgi:hypothetical protein